LAVIVKRPRETRVNQAESRGLAEAVLAGPGSGCNRFTVRRITLALNGRTARTSFHQGVVYFIHRGKVALSHGEGELDHLSPGETAIVHPDELHHLQNIHTSQSCIIAAVAQ